MTITGNATLAGVMGWPVGHSLSPRLHGYWLVEYGVDGAYVPLNVAPDGFAGALRALPTLGFAGVNVTVPHKEAAVRAVDAVDNFAARVGAVNTVVVDHDGGLNGMNTDGFGFRENLNAGAPDWSATAPAVVLGAGGAARAIVAALLDLGVKELRLVNRTRPKAEALAGALGGAVRVLAWEDRAEALDGAGLLVNATTLGMAGAGPLDLALDALPAAAVVNDIVYTPLETPLLKDAQARGNPTVDGLGMLLHQARPGFERWFGTAPTVTDRLRAFVAEGLGG